MKQYYTLLFPGSPLLNKVLTVLLTLFFFIPAFSANYYSRGNGNWSNKNTWSLACGGGALGAATALPGAGDNIFICCNGTNATVTVDGNYSCNNLTIGSANANGIVQITNSANSLTIIGALTFNTTNQNKIFRLDAGPGIVNINGTFVWAGITQGTNGLQVSTGTINITPAITIDNAFKSIVFIGGGTINFLNDFTDQQNKLTTVASSSVNFSKNYTVNTTNAVWNTTSNANFSGNSPALITVTSAATLTFGNISIAGTASLQLAGTQTGFFVKGNWTNNGGTFDASTNSKLITFNGTANQTISKSGGQASFYDFTSNKTSGIIILGSDVFVKNTLTMTAGNYNLSGFTFTLGQSAASTLSRTAGIMYGGTFKRWWIAGALTTTNYGLFPVGVSTGYRPVEIASTAAPTAAGYIQAIHTEDLTTTDVSYNDNNAIAIQRVSNAFTTVSLSSGSTLTGGTYNLNVTYTGLKNLGAMTDEYLETLPSVNGAGVGASAATAGSVSNPTVKRTGVSLANLQKDFVLATKNKAATPLRAFYYAIANGNWNANGTWSQTSCSGSAGTSFPAAGDEVIICGGKTVSLNVNSFCNNITLQGTGSLNCNNNGITLTATGNFEMQATSSIQGGNSNRVISVTGNFNVISGANVSIDLVTMNVAGDASLDGGLTSSANNGVVNITGNLNINSGGSLNFNTNGWTYNVTGNLNASNGGSLGDVSTVNNGTVIVSGNLNVLDGGSGIFKIGRLVLEVRGTTNVDGKLNFSDFQQGRKKFRNDIILSSTGQWQNSVGEDPEIDGNIINNGSWIGNTGGTANYQFGRNGQVAGPSPYTYTISGNPISFSQMTIYGGTTVINQSSVVIDGGVSPAVKYAGAGTAYLQNGDGNSAATIYFKNTGGNPSDGVDNNANLKFYASYANNTVYYNRSDGNDQNIYIPDDGCYYDLVCANNGTKFVKNGTTGIINSLTIKDNAIVIEVAGKLLKDCGSPSSSAAFIMSDNSEFQSSACSPAVVPQFTGSFTLSGNSTITLNGNCALQTLQPGNIYNNLALQGNAGGAGSQVDMTGISTVNGNITITNTANILNAAFAMDCSKSFTYSSSKTMTLTNDITVGSFYQTNIGGSVFNDGGRTITVCGSSFDRAGQTFTATGTVIFNGTTTVSGAGITTFNNVVINAGKTLIGHSNSTTGMEVKGNWQNDGTYTHNSGIVVFKGTSAISGSSITTFNHLTIDATATSVIGHPTNINMEGNWTNNKASGLVPNSGTVTFTLGAAQNLAGSQTTSFFNLTVNKTAATTLSQTAATATVNNLLTMTEGIFNVGANALNGAGGFTATGGDLQLASTIVTVPELTGTYSITGGTVTLNKSGVQTLRTSTTGGSTYYNLVFSSAAAGAKTITGLLIINGDVTVSGAATLTANSAFVQASSKTFNYNSASITTLAAGVAVTVGNYTQTAGTLTIPNNAGNIFTVAGASWNKSGGAFNSSITLSTVKFQGDNVAQTFTDNGTNFNKIILDNSLGLTLNNDMAIVAGANALTFTNGKITTGSNNVILTSTAATVITPGTGKFVEGNLRKAIAVAQTKTFEVGTGTDYTPATFVFAGNTAGNWTVSSTEGDHPDIFASSFNPSKTVNRYWTVTNNSIATVGTYSATCNYINPDDMDASFDWTLDTLLRYDGTIWNGGNAVTIRTSTSIKVAGISTPASGSTEVFQIGNDYNSASFWNRVTGPCCSNLWSNKATWIQDRKGGITTSTASTTVTGTGTKFTTELVVGDILMTQILPGTIIGTVASITNDATLTLTANSGANNAGASYGRQKVPDINDEVNIGNPNLSGAAVTIVQDMANAECNRIYFTPMALPNVLTHNAGTNLHVATNVTVRHPSNANINTWNLNAGIATLDGNLQISHSPDVAGAIAKVIITTGTLNIGTNLIFQTATDANAVLDMSGGDGRANLTGTFTVSSKGTLNTAGSENVFNYNRTVSSQVVNFPTTGAYRNLYLNNTSAGGAILSAAVSATNITGNIRTQSGIFTNGGFAIAGNAGRQFIVDANAIFRMTGTAVFPTVFGTFTFDPASTTQYWQSNAQTISPQTYGNLQCMPAVAGIAQSIANAQTVTVMGNLIVGNGANTGTMQGAATATLLDVRGNITINPSGTLNQSNIIDVKCSGDWTNNGTFTPGARTVTFNGTGAQAIGGSSATHTFYNVIVTKTAGTILSCAAGVTAMNTNNVTVNTGTFNVPATLNLNGSTSASLTLNGGILNAGANITIRQHWTNNGGTFNHNNGKVTWSSSSAVTANINGTAVSQTFYDLEINKTNLSVAVTASTTTLNVLNDFTQTNFGLNVSAATTLNVGRHFTITTSTFSPCNNINIGGNIVRDGGTLTWGTNVTLNGSVKQTISGAGVIPNFTNLTINNTYPAAAVVLNNPVTVNGIFTLTDGHILTDNTNILSLGANASVALSALVTQDSSFVKGPMTHTKASASTERKIFPVGKDNKMHRADLKVTHTVATSATFTGEYLNSSAAALNWALPTTGELLDHVSYVGMWDISCPGCGAGFPSQAFVTLYYDTTFDAVSDIANLRVAKGNPSAWTNLGGIGTAADTIKSTIVFSTFSRFALANKTGGTNPLPIELVYFNAELNNTKVDLSWITVTEINNDYFTIEKTKDGVEFTEVIKVKGAGNSSSIKEYKTIDKNPYKGISYYRLKQTDFDGKFSYSELVPINNPEGREVVFTVYPNPSDGENINVSLSGYEKEEEVLVLLHDIEGRLVYSKVVLTDDNGSFVTAIDPHNNLPAGMYFVVGSSRNEIYSRKLVIK